MKGICRICGQSGSGMAFEKWVRPTFTNRDLLFPGEIICDACTFWFEQQSTELQRRMGKDKPQRMQNYSHFVVAGEWMPLSKSDKSRMVELLLSNPFPELAAIADSGQKHIVFRARRNRPGQKSGWVQFEEQSLYVEPDELKALLGIIEELYDVFSKSEIRTGEYKSYRIRDFGIDRWQKLDEQIRCQREKLLFSLALFLAQKRSDDGSDKRNGKRTADADLARDSGRLQESLPDDDLESVRKRNPERGLYEQPGQVYQLDLFTVASDHRCE